MTIKKISRFVLMLMFCLPLFSGMCYRKGSKQNYYQLKIYHYSGDTQQQKIEAYLQNAYLPALHHAGIKTVGVFKTAENDTAEKLIYVFIPFTSLEQFEQLEGKLQQDNGYLAAGKDYIDAVYNNAPYKRLESILLKAFVGMPEPAVPALTGNKAERVYELRSYESPTEKYYKSKVKMFNVGDEVGLFKRLGFNAVFYSEVLSGSHMPNLMYMTTFINKEDREKRWKAFFDDPHWKNISAMEEYQHNVSKADIFFLHPTEYSDF